MTGATSIVPFASLALLLGYVALRTGSLLPGILVHVLLDVITLAYFAGELSTPERVSIAATGLVALVLGFMVAGRRLGLRRLMPSVIDLRHLEPVAHPPVTG
jgi:membrane protease YdiL (CAAX protease family)